MQRKTLKTFVKLTLTIAIFAAIFMEFGGGPVEISVEDLHRQGFFERSNPAMPNFIGRLKAHLTGQSLPPKRIPVSIEKVCQAAMEGEVFFTKDDTPVAFKAMRHCEGARLTTVYLQNGDTKVALAQTQGRVQLIAKGFSLVPMDMHDLWTEVRQIELRQFLPWFIFAMLIKLLGIFANVLRWQILLHGQGLRFGYRDLCSTYFVGRYFGIVTPGTMGLDGWRLYDTISRTKKPVECTTAIAVERVIGMVGLLTVILLFMPLTNLEGRTLGELALAMKLPLTAVVLFSLFVLLRPTWFTWLPRLMPLPKISSFVAKAIESATAYSSQKSSLLLALACAVFGQITTMFMYFGNAMALGGTHLPMADVLYASAVMTLGTFLAPSASGEGVRELIFVALLGGKTTAAKAFLIGHLGFWIEKLPLSIPGAILFFRRPESLEQVATKTSPALINVYGKKG
jgi:uncharacterized membrane protein YbhN (UPF0104 family)